uniref:Uncharacterized protein n=1 Tax=Knipowitschia caucasica TaxID=637954 RepID=A0AAV2L8V1_KNICA
MGGVGGWGVGGWRGAWVVWCFGLGYSVVSVWLGGCVCLVMLVFGGDRLSVCWEGVWLGGGCGRRGVCVGCDGWGGWEVVVLSGCEFGLVGGVAVVMFGWWGCGVFVVWLGGISGLGGVGRVRFGGVCWGWGVGVGGGVLWVGCGLWGFVVGDVEVCQIWLGEGCWDGLECVGGVVYRVLGGVVGGGMVDVLGVLGVWCVKGGGWSVGRGVWWWGVWRGQCGCVGVGWVGDEAGGGVVCGVRRSCVVSGGGGVWCRCVLSVMVCGVWGWLVCGCVSCCGGMELGLCVCCGAWVVSVVWGGGCVGRWRVVRSFGGGVIVVGWGFCGAGGWWVWLVEACSVIRGGLGWRWNDGGLGFGGVVVGLWLVLVGVLFERMLGWLEFCGGGLGVVVGVVLVAGGVIVGCGFGVVLCVVVWVVCGGTGWSRGVVSVGGLVGMLGVVVGWVGVGSWLGVVFKCVSWLVEWGGCVCGVVGCGRCVWLGGGLWFLGGRSVEGEWIVGCGLVVVVLGVLSALSGVCWCLGGLRGFVYGCALVRGRCERVVVVVVLLVCEVWRGGCVWLRRVVGLGSVVWWCRDAGWGVWGWVVWFVGLWSCGCVVVVLLVVWVCCWVGCGACKGW